VRAAHALMAGQGLTLLDQAAETYLAEISSTVRKQTLQEKRRHIQKLSSQLGPATDVSSITRRVAGQYVSRVLIPEGKAPKTTRDEIGHLSAFFNWLERRGEIESNPFFRISGSVRESTRGRTPARRPWTDQELMLLLEGMPSDDPLWAMVAISAYSGMRREEVARLRVVDVDGNSWRVTEGKSQAAVRTVPMHPVLRPLVKSLITSTDDGFLIPGLLSGGADEKRGHMVGKRFTQVRQRLGITDEALNFHTLRNAFLQRCEEAGVPQASAKQLAGHKRTDLTYGRYSPGTSLDALEAEIRKVSYGAVDKLVKSTGSKVTITSRPRRRRTSKRPTVQA
jgi:integrase